MKIASASAAAASASAADLSRIRPLGDHVVIRPLYEEMSPGGIHYAEQTAKKACVRGEVVAVGPGRVLESGERVPCEVSVGDVVLFPEQMGLRVQVEGVELLCMGQEYLHSVLPREYTVR